MTDQKIYREAMERENNAPFPHSYKTAFYDGAKWMQKQLQPKVDAYDRIMEQRIEEDYITRQHQDGSTVD